jgi:RNA polymerase sigma factor (sigma-70 family)
MDYLTKEESKELAIKAKAGCKESMKRLLDAKMGIVLNIAKRWRHCAKRGIDQQDIQHWGIVGTLEAIAGYNPDKGGLDSYIYRLATQRIINALQMSGTSIRLTKTYYKNRRFIQKECPDAKTPHEVAAVTRFSAEYASNLLQKPKLVGFDTMVLTARDDMEVLEASIEVDQLMDKSKMSCRNKDILLRLYSGYDCVEVAKHYEVSRQRIHKLAQESLQKLKCTALEAGSGQKRTN